MAGPDNPRDDVARYFGTRIREHGPTPQGVDWNSDAAQLVRFDQLLRIVDPSGPFSINDYGCGYGALLDLMVARGWPVDYRGFDISRDMVEAARAHHGEDPAKRFVGAVAELEPADYTVAKETLDEMGALSRRGFAFNALTSYSDPEHMRDDLYYADPCALFDLCKRRYSRQVALLHDYGIWDFTILVRLAS
jgi:SAM-dependent methyltransferase